MPVIKNKKSSNDTRKIPVLKKGQSTGREGHPVNRYTSLYGSSGSIGPNALGIIGPSLPDSGDKKDPIASLIYSHTGIPIRFVSRHLDRMVITVRNISGIPRYELLAAIRANFIFDGSPKLVNGRLVYFGLSANGERIEAAWTKGSKWWTSISIYEPSRAMQKKVYDVLNEPWRNREFDGVVILSKVEFSTDIFPTEPDNLEILLHKLFPKMVLRDKLHGPSEIIGSTWYWTVGRTIHKGSFGIRGYPRGWDSKDEKDFLRVELQANQKLLKKTGLTIESLPINADTLSPFDYVYLLGEDYETKLCRRLTRIQQNLTQRFGGRVGVR
jgi:hypothetical protein